MAHSPPVPRLPEDRRPSEIRPTCDCFVNKGMTFDRQLGLHFCADCGAYEWTNDRSDHQLRIEEFMVGIGHHVADNPAIPPVETRYLRARLILEEALETIQALGFGLRLELGQQQYVDISPDMTLIVDTATRYEPNLIEIADGCGDISVVTIGTLSACGIADKPVLAAVDHNNLTKVKPLCPKCRSQMVQVMLDGNHVGWECRGEPTCTPLAMMFGKEVGGYEREDGKWVKGTAHRKVDLAEVLRKQQAHIG